MYCGDFILLAFLLQQYSMQFVDMDISEIQTVVSASTNRYQTKRDSTVKEFIGKKVAAMVSTSRSKIVWFKSTQHKNRHFNKSTFKVIH